MAAVLIYDEITNRGIRYLKSANTPDYINRTDVLINPDISNVSGLSVVDWEVSGINVIPYVPPLADTKEDLISKIKSHRTNRINNVLFIEHPDASGNYFSVTFTDQQNWHGLYTARTLASYPILIRTADELTQYSVSDATEVETLFGKVFSTVQTEIATAQTAIANVVSAIDATAAQIAADVYLNT